MKKPSRSIIAFLSAVGFALLAADSGAATPKKRTPQAKRVVTEEGQLSQMLDKVSSSTIVAGFPLPGDSPLVRAAKIANLSRAHYAMKGVKSMAINQWTLKSLGPLSPAAPASSITSSSSGFNFDPPDRSAIERSAAAEKRIEALDREMRVLSEEDMSDTPNEAEEDQIQRRLGAIPGEIANQVQVITASPVPVAPR